MGMLFGIGQTSTQPSPWLTVEGAERLLHPETPFTAAEIEQMERFRHESYAEAERASDCKWYQEFWPRSCPPNVACPQCAMRPSMKLALGLGVCYVLWRLLT